MSTNRLGDYVTALPLHIADIAAIGGSRAIPGLTLAKAAQASLGAMAVTGGGGADTLDVKLQESDAPKLADQINGYDGVDDGSRKLRSAAATDLQIAIPFTPAVDMTIQAVDLMLSSLGTIAAGESVWVEIDTDAAGDPAGAEVSGAQALTESRKVEAVTVPDSITPTRFYFEDGVDLTAATLYWIKLSGDTTLSATDCIQVHYNTVVGTSGCKKYDAAWAAIANEDVWFKLYYCEFTDIAGAVFTQITEGWLNAIDVAERIEVDFKTVKDTVRAHYTVSGGTWTIGNIVNVGLPNLAPLT